MNAANEFDQRSALVIADLASLQVWLEARLEKDAGLVAVAFGGIVGMVLFLFSFDPRSTLAIGLYLVGLDALVMTVGLGTMLYNYDLEAYRALLVSLEMSVREPAITRLGHAAVLCFSLAVAAVAALALVEFSDGGFK